MNKIYAFSWCLFILASADASLGESVASNLSQQNKGRATASTVIIRTPFAGGSGFAVEDNGKKYIVTNQHVLLGVKRESLEIITTQGSKLTPLALQVVTDKDLARIEVAESPPGLSFASDANVDEAVATMGNSLDAGVITLNPGKIKGIGAEELEVDCEVVPGQSGGPLINESGDVLGVTTYIVFADKDKSSEGTRYARKRYFILRVGPQTEWKAISNWDEYARIGEVVRNGEDVLEDAIDIASSADGGPDQDYQYDGNNKKLSEAAINHNRFVSKMTKMDGDVVTSSELKRNNDSLAVNFRAIYRALIDACIEAETAIQREIRTGRPKLYPWVADKANETLEMLAYLRQSLESNSKARPQFLTW